MTETRTAEPATAAYLARRSVATQWRVFLRGLVETLDANLDAEGRAALLRAVGRRMADAMPLPHCDTLAGLQAHMNDALGGAEWGYCSLAVNVETQRLLVTHAAAPAVGAGDDADGGWVAAVLEGLYGRLAGGAAGRRCGVGAGAGKVCAGRDAAGVWEGGVGTPQVKALSPRLRAYRMHTSP